MAKIVKIAGIDFQHDFCTPDGQIAGLKTGRLLVPGAYAAGERTAKYIRSFGRHATDMVFTLDNHPEMHIAHTVFWQDSLGKNPDNLTEITVEDVEARRWTPVIPSEYAWCLHYVKQLKAQNRYVLRVWNPHCKIGSPGAALIQPIEDALNEWAIKMRATVSFRPKGTNFRTEHYSAMRAEVEDPKDVPNTGVNKQLVEDFEQCDELHWTGIAGDFCLKNTMVDAFTLNPDTIKKSVLLLDAQASIFPAVFDQFVKEYTAKGLKTAMTTDFI